MRVEIKNAKGESMGFGRDFFWGGATASNQYEGGVFEGGAGSRLPMP